MEKEKDRRKSRKRMERIFCYYLEREVNRKNKNEEKVEKKRMCNLDEERIAS